MVLALGYLLRVSTATNTQLVKPRGQRRRPIGMVAETRDLRRVRAGTASAEKFALKEAETAARIIAAAGDPNVPRNPEALAVLASRAYARVLSARTGQGWVAAS